MSDLIKVKTIDLHAAGEPCRVIYDYFYDIPGDTMFDKKRYLTEHGDHIRKALMLEPRGHSNMFGSILTKPVSEDADAGVIFLTNSGYLDMCIHGSICTSRAVMELGIKPKNDGKVVFDTVGGRVTAYLHYNEDGSVSDVEIENVPSFVYNEEPIVMNIAGLGEIRADIVFAGNFFVVVDGAQNEKLYVSTDRYEYLAQIGMEIKNYINTHVDVVHPLKPELRGVSLTVIFNRKNNSPKHVKNVVVFGNRQVDRSPCGTGTSGLMVYFHSIDELAMGQSFDSESIIGSFFQGYLKSKCEVAGRSSYMPRVKGKPSVMAYSEFVLEPEDVYQFGIPVIL